MSKVAVVYWSGTGNTAIMAQAVADGAKAKGAECDLLTSAEFTAHMVANYDAIAFGCPAMGAEVLEESEFEPMFAECEPVLNGKKIAIFGSYGWGSGEWMDTWEAQCQADGVVFAASPLICHETPDEAGLAECTALGEALV